MSIGEVLMPGGWFLVPFFGLAVSQTTLYRVPQKSAIRSFWFLGFFYFFLFAFARGIVIFSEVFSLAYCELPIYVLAALILFQKTGKPFPLFETVGRLKIDFYLFSAVWTGLTWFFFIFNLEPRFFETREEVYLKAFLWSFFPASVFPILTGMRERLTLTAPPKVLEGTPVFLIASGIFFLAIFFLWSFIN